MKKILLIVSFLFSSVLLINCQFSSVEALKTRINVDFEKLPTTNPLWINVVAKTTDGQRSDTGLYNAYEYDGAYLDLELGGTQGQIVYLCVERHNFNLPNCYNITSDEYTENVNLEIPCRNDCPVAGLSTRDPDPDSGPQDVLDAINPFKW
jgi:hypothetical protein